MAAEFRVMLPGGGAFYAAWPQTVTDVDLRMVRAMLGLTLDWWIDKLEAEKAAEREYRSWFPISAPGVEAARCTAVRCTCSPVQMLTCDRMTDGVETSAQPQGEKR